MPKKEVKAEESKKIQRHDWVHFLVVLIIATLFLLIFTNGFSLVTGNAVRGGGTKKPDLVPYGSNMEDLYYKLGENSMVLANIQVGTGTANIGNARAKESLLVVGVQGDSLIGVKTSAFVVDTTGTLRSAATDYYSIYEVGPSIGIKVGPLQPGTGERYTIHFLDLPIGSPPLDGTPLETKFTLYGIADTSSVISESNENNNNISRSYIFHCAYDPPGSFYPFCCVKRVDPLSPRYAGIRYCEDLGIY